MANLKTTEVLKGKARALYNAAPSLKLSMEETLIVKEVCRDTLVLIEERQGLIDDINKMGKERNKLRKVVEAAKDIEHNGVHNCLLCSRPCDCGIDELKKALAEVSEGE